MRIPEPDADGGPTAGFIAASVERRV